MQEHSIFRENTHILNLSEDNPSEPLFAAHLPLHRGGFVRCVISPFVVGFVSGCVHCADFFLCRDCNLFYSTI